MLTVKAGPFGGCAIGLGRYQPRRLPAPVPSTGAARLPPTAQSGNQTTDMPSTSLTRVAVFSSAWPLIFANGAVPLAGVADTFVLGLTGATADLAGVGAGAAVFGVFFYSVNFLRMGTTGLVSQAVGAENRNEVQRILLRALLLAVVLGIVVVLLRHKMSDLGFWALGTEPEVTAKGGLYIAARAWGAPAAFAVFAITGWLIATGRMFETLSVAFVFSATNIVLDLIFVLGLGFGPAGVGAATAIGDWMGLIAGIWFVRRSIRADGGWVPAVWRRDELLNGQAMRKLFDVNINLMIRTWMLILGFTYFVKAGARQGTVALAGNHILLQIITLWAFVLDAFAFVAEAETGRAYGRRSISALRRAFRFTMEQALIGGVIFASLTYFLGELALSALIADEAARVAALAFLPYCAMVPFLGAPAWVLDGVFVGTTNGAMHRNANIISVIAYISVDLLLAPRLGNHGVWMAFLAYFVARTVAMGAYYPKLEARIA
jgi:MATE family multidrug resistance protein